MTAIGNTNSLLTIDSLVRMYIHERGMVWHDYLLVLGVALSGLRDLAKDIDVGSSYKAKELEVDSSNAVKLPEDCLKVNKVCIEAGDKILPMANIDDMNPLQKYVDGYPVKRDQKKTGFKLGGEPITYFGIPVSQPYGYQVFGNRIQIDSRIKEDCVLVIYNTTGTSVSDINMVHPWAEEALKLWIDWKFPNTNKGVYEKRSGRKDYYDSKSALYGAIHGMGYEDYMKTIRDNAVITYKQ